MSEANPLQTIIDEFKTLSPETTNAIIFKNNGQTIANTQTDDENQTRKFILGFGSIESQAQIIGGIEALTIQTAENQLSITAIDNHYLATISGTSANPEVLKSLTQVVIPTVVRLIEKKVVLPIENQPLQAPISSDVVEVKEETPSTAIKEPEIKPINEPTPPAEPFLPSTPVNQFMVEKIGGLLVAADTVRIDNEIIASWSKLYGGKQITTVNIEALDGKKTTCKFKPIKETKAGNQGIIQIPEKILQTLQIEKGTLVMVKPIIE